MRKLIVKLFALSYVFKVFGKEIYVPRAATPITGSLALSMLGAMLENKLIYSTGLILTLITVFIGFVYFRLGNNSIEWNELDKVQKRLYFKLPFVFLSSEETKEGALLDTQKIHNGLLALILNLIFWLTPFLTILI